ncbi:hypothetical protein GCM10027291_32110 [Telluribacter humicola]
MTLITIPALLILLNNLQSNQFITQRFFRFVPDYAIGEDYETSRVVVWPRTLGLIISNLDRLFLLGLGIGDFSLLYTGMISNSRYYPHNILLELIVELGILFTTILFIFVIYIIKNFGNNNNKYLLYFFIINSMFSGDIILNEFIFFYLGTMAINSN